MGLAVDFAVVGWILADCMASAVCTVVELVAGCSRLADKQMVVGSTMYNLEWMFVVVGNVAVLELAAGKLEKDKEIQSLVGTAALDAGRYSAFPVVAGIVVVD